MVRLLSSCVKASEPTASATSTAPDATAFAATWNAVDAEAHAFSTFKIATPLNPYPWNAA